MPCYIYIYLYIYIYIYISYIDKWKGCFNAGAEPFCDAEGMKFLRWGADAYVADLTDLACSSKLSWGGDRCAKLQAALDTAPAANSTETPPKSVIVPMFRIITAFADWEKRGPPRLRKLE